MKTLDEVVEAQERCSTYPNCHFCYLHSGSICEWIRDALHYLREYQERLQNLQDMMDRYDISVKNYEEAVENCRIAEQKYWRMTNNVEDMNPLTWDELRTMEGKPVWIKWTKSEESYWCFVGEWFDDDEMRIYRMGWDYADYIHKTIYTPDIVQAYRKERHEDD